MLGMVLLKYRLKAPWEKQHEKGCEDKEHNIVWNAINKTLKETDWFTRCCKTQRIVIALFGKSESK